MPPIGWKSREAARKSQQATAAAAARKRAAAQQAAYQKRQQQQAAYNQTQRKREAERLARFKKQERQSQIAENRRQGALAQQRRTHIVERGQSIEDIASKYGMEPQEALRQANVKTLRAGQEFQFTTPSDRAKEMGTDNTFTPPTEWFSEKRDTGDLGRQLKFVQNEGLASPGGLGTPMRERMGAGAPPGSGFAGGQDREPFQTGETYLSPAQEEEQQARSQFMNIMRYTGQALQYAWTTGDRDVLKGTGQFADQSIYLTDYMMSEFRAAFGDHVVEKIISLGFYQTPEGDWIMMDVEEPEYGMGEYGSYPGYGGGYGGGGGAYEAPYYTKGGSSHRGDKSGVRTRGKAGQLFAGNVARTHWRI